MNKFSTKIYLVLFIVLVFAVLAVVSAKKISHSNLTQPIGGEKQVLSNRDLAIKKVLESPESILQKVDIKGNTYLLTSYEDTFYGGGPIENKPGWKFGGILVFRIEKGHPVLFWENDEAINSGSSEFLDIDNDKIPEVVWSGYFGATGRDSAFYVYKFDDVGFKLITPVKTIETSLITYKITTLGGDSELTFMKDVDDDNIQEFIVDAGIENEDKRFEIYKYDGEKYYFWKKGRVKPGNIQPQFWGSFDPTYIRRFIEE